MSQLFKKTVDQLPQILIKNANAMMLRMVAAMQKAIAADLALENATYCGLVLKTAAGTLALEFERAVSASWAAMRSDGELMKFAASGFSLSIEPLEPVVSTAQSDLQASTDAFSRLRIKANALGVRGLGVSSKDVMLACMLEAFGNARVQASEVATMLPYARRALNEELIRLYAKLDAL